MSHDDSTTGAHAKTAAPHSSRSMGFIKGAARLFGPSVAIAFVAPFVFPGVRRALRPVAKGLIQGGIMLGESAVEAATAARAELNDLVEEAKADRDRQTRDLNPDRHDHA
jgi:hypothetical protein